MFQTIPFHNAPSSHPPKHIIFTLYKETFREVLGGLTALTSLGGESTPRKRNLRELRCTSAGSSWESVQLQMHIRE